MSAFASEESHRGTCQAGGRSMTTGLRLEPSLRGDGKGAMCRDPVSSRGNRSGFQGDDLATRFAGQFETPAGILHPEQNHAMVASDCSLSCDR